MQPHLHRGHGLLVLMALMSAVPRDAQPQEAAPMSIQDYTVRLDVIHSGFDGKTCWVHPRAGTIPGEPPVVVLISEHLVPGRDEGGPPPGIADAVGP